MARRGPAGFALDQPARAKRQVRGDGALAALIDVSLTWLLQIGFGLLSADPARAVGFIVGTWAAYLLNRRWTFQAKATAVRFAGVLATYGVTFVVNMVAFAISQGTATVVNFAVQRWIILGRRGSGSSPSRIRPSPG